ncbi:MAG: T9SS type A sorting domain-containing protein [Saprospiraceae bacterium]|nr:T9SS type A sorting domain-containing protein [Saprospiraceae bacterium]
MVFSTKNVKIFFSIFIFNLAIQGIYGQEDTHCNKASFLLNRQLELRTITSGATDNADIVFHHCKWQIDPNSRFISGQIKTNFIAKTDLSSIEFDLHNDLSVSSIEFRGGSVPFTHSNNLLVADLQTTVASGMNESISVTYSGVPPTSGFGSFTQTTHGSPAAGIIWTLSEPYGAKDWWPCKQNLNDKIDSIRIEVTVPSPNKVASNGILESVTPNGGFETYTYVHNYPIAAYLVAFAATNYVFYEDNTTIGGQNLTTENYVYPESVVAFQQNTPLLHPVMQYFSNTFGNYPFLSEKYGHTQCGFGGGMEHQTNSFVGNASLGLLTHELAHQWFGDKVTCGSWQDIWLNEGFASYLTALTYEQGIQSSWWDWKNNVNNNITSLTNGSVYVPATDTLNTGRVFNSRLSYNKGAYALHMIRWKIGDAAFFSAINNYLNDASIAYKYAKTPQLKQYFEAASGTSLTEYFSDYVYGEGHPTYTFTWYQDPITKVLQVKVNQTTSHPSVGFFDMKLHLRAQSIGGLAVEDLIFENTANDQIFYFSMPFDILSLDFDPDRNVLNARAGLQIIQSATTLPITLIKFSGKSIAKNNQLEIVIRNTDPEMSKLYLEKSKDGLNFEEIETFSLAQSVENKLFFLDEKVNTSVSYYRLKWKEINAFRYTYSKILSISNSQIFEEKIFVYPNPCYKSVNIQSTMQDGNNIQYQIFDLHGKLVMEGKGLESKTKLDLSNIPNGKYHLVILNKDKIIGTEEIIKQD